MLPDFNRRTDGSPLRTYRLDEVVPGVQAVTCYVDPVEDEEHYTNPFPGAPGVPGLFLPDGLEPPTLEWFSGPDWKGP